MYVLLLMWAYSANPVVTIPFTSFKACQTAQFRFESTYGENLVVNRCVDQKTGNTY